MGKDMNSAQLERLRAVAKRNFHETVADFSPQAVLALLDLLAEKDARGVRLFLLS